MGGDGFDAPSGTNQDGGNGGDAGNISVFFQSIHSHALGMLIKIAGAYIDGSLAGKQELLKDVSALFSTSEDLSKCESCIKILAQFKEIQNQAVSEQGLLLLGKINVQLTVAENNIRNECLRRTDTRGGYYGTGARIYSKLQAAANGESGVSTKPTVAAWKSPEDQCLWNIPCAHPVQCQMLLEKAKLAYFVGGTPSPAKALMYLERLRDRLASVDVVTETSPLRKAYGKNALSLFISDTVGDGKVTINNLKAINAEAVAYIDQLQKGRDYYGKTPSYVPRGSYHLYMSSELGNDTVWETLRIVE